MLHFVKKIVDVQPYTLTLEFNTGEVKRIDLENSFLQWSTTPESKFRELLDKNNFANVKLDKELETIYWDNGIDLCPDVLYEMGK